MLKRRQVTEAVNDVRAATAQSGERIGDAVAGVRAVAAQGARVREDREFRRELTATLEHAARATRRAQELNRPRRHTLRNSLLLAGAGAAAAVANGGVRRRVGLMLGDVRRSFGGIGVVQEMLELEVPVSTAYNQWTQFEEFPRFMDGVEEVRQLDDSRLHWVASIGGRRVEWNAKILEQHPDRQVSWVAEDGRTTRGTVAFEPCGDACTQLMLSMSYRLDGLLERLGLALGLDRRRIHGDLQRFKRLLETRGSESGGWRGDITSGETATGATASAGPVTVAGKAGGEQRGAA